MKLNKRVVLFLVSIPLGCCAIILLAYGIFQADKYSPTSPGVDLLTRPVWSPDGNLIAFECTFYTKEDIDSIRFDSRPLPRTQQQICLSKRDGSDFRVLTGERYMYYPSWSPDGKSLAWMHNDDTVMIMEFPTGGVTQYKSDKMLYPYDWTDDGQYIMWSPKGDTIFFQGIGTAFDIKSSQFYKHIMLEKHKITRGRDFVLSPNGKYLAGVVHIGPDVVDDKLQVYEQERLVFESNVSPVSGSLIWSHDGTVLCWVSIDWHASPPPPSSFSLFMTYFPSGETIQMQLPSDVYVIDLASWSLDDRKIGFSDSATERIYWFSLDDKKRSLGQYSYLEAYTMNPLTWSPDAESFAYDAADNIIIMNLDGSHRKLIDK